MSQYTTRQIIEKRVEVVLPSPTNWAELGKTLNYCHQTVVSNFDDAVTVEAREGEIVLWWKEESS